MRPDRSSGLQVEDPQLIESVCRIGPRRSEARDGQQVSIRCESNRVEHERLSGLAHRIAQAGQGLLQFSRCYIPEPHESRVIHAGHGLAVGSEGYRSYGRRLSPQDADLFSLDHIPEVDNAVKPCRGECFAVGGVDER